jgi:hypothetical protein
MEHLLKLNCAYSNLELNVSVLPSTSVPFTLIYTHDGASAKFSTNSQETDFTVHFYNDLPVCVTNKMQRWQFTIRQTADNDRFNIKNSVSAGAD